MVSKRTFGRTGLEISEVGYGAWGVGGKQWLNGSDEESIAALHRAIELGLNFIDTALAYGDGHSERLVGRVAREAKSRIYLATKIPPKNRIWPARAGTPIEDVFPYDYIIRSTEESLKNLGVETVDLQQFHVWSPAWLESGEWRRGIEDLKRSGKVRFIGISINDHQPDSVLDVLRTGLIDTVQVIYNIFDQSPETNLFPLCRQLNIGVLARCPLDEGALAGTIDLETKFEAGEFREFYFRTRFRREQMMKHVDGVRRELTDVPGTLAEKALRFAISQPAVTSVIPGMRKVRHVESNLGIPGPLPAEALHRLKRHAWRKCFYQ